jgi:hypothetical protein
MQIVFCAPLFPCKTLMPSARTMFRPIYPITKDWAPPCPRIRWGNGRPPGLAVNVATPQSDGVFNRS